MEKFVNDAESSASGSVDGSSDPVVVSVNDGSVFPATGNFRVRIDDEILLCTSRSGDDLTCSRAQEGTTIASHSSSVPVTHVLTAASLSQIIRENSWRPYYPFVPGPEDDEFDDDNFSGWTLVEGSTVCSYAEFGSQLSIRHPGGGTGNQYNAIMKSATVSIGDSIETCMRLIGPNENYNMICLIMANGTTYGAGSQLFLNWSPQQNLISFMTFTNYSTIGTNTTFNLLTYCPFMCLRMTYTAANTFKGEFSTDGYNWVVFNASMSMTLTPTAVGIGVGKFGGAGAMVASIEYFKKRP